MSARFSTPLLGRSRAASAAPSLLKPANLPLVIVLCCIAMPFLSMQSTFVSACVWSNARSWTCIPCGGIYSCTSSGGCIANAGAVPGCSLPSSANNWFCCDADSCDVNASSMCSYTPPSTFPTPSPSPSSSSCSSCSTCLTSCYASCGGASNADFSCNAAGGVMIQSCSCRSSTSSTSGSNSTMTIIIVVVVLIAVCILACVFWCVYDSRKRAALQMNQTAMVGGWSRQVDFNHTNMTNQMGASAIGMKPMHAYNPHETSAPMQYMNHNQMQMQMQPMPANINPMPINAVYNAAPEQAQTLSQQSTMVVPQVALAAVDEPEKPISIDAVQVSEN